jgi:hypothetical protein
LENHFPTSYEDVRFSRADEALIKVFFVGLVNFFTAHETTNESDRGVTDVIYVQEKQRDKEVPSEFFGSCDCECGEEKTEWRAADVAHEHPSTWKIMGEKAEGRAREG